MTVDVVRIKVYVTICYGKNDVTSNKLGFGDKEINLFATAKIWFDLHLSTIGSVMIKFIFSHFLFFYRGDLLEAYIYGSISMYILWYNFPLRKSFIWFSLCIFRSVDGLADSVWLLFFWNCWCLLCTKNIDWKF